MSSVTHPRVPVGVIWKLIELLPAATQEMAREIVHTAEFRLLETLEDQIVYIRDNTPFPLDVISDMLNVGPPSTATCRERSPRELPIQPHRALPSDTARTVP